MRETKLNPKTYNVWIDQVNQVVVQVKAKSADEARVVAYAKWRIECAHSRTTDVQEVK
jgi:hypothetical protein